jgi:hypothetical protein
VLADELARAGHEHAVCGVDVERALVVLPDAHDLAERDRRTCERVARALPPDAAASPPASFVRAAALDDEQAVMDGSKARRMNGEGRVRDRARRVSMR